MQIETSFDAYKNIIHADRTYMHHQKGVESWMFMNHIALMCYYKIYQLLLKNNMLNKYAPLDIMKSLMQVRQLKINNKWVISEIPKKINDILVKMGIPITC